MIQVSIAVSVNFVTVIESPAQKLTGVVVLNSSLTHE